MSVASLLSLLLLAACGPRLPPAPSVPVRVLEPSLDLPPYRIQVGDILDVRVFQTPELNDEVTVRPDGQISTTLVKDERAVGRTVPELADVLQHSYAEFVLKPRLTVVVKTFTPDRIYVAGEVNSPGEFITMPPNLTLSQAIARAGGVKLSGNSDDVFIIRRSVGDHPIIYATNYAALKRSTDAAADVRLENFDVVYVPRTIIADVYLFFNQYLQQFVPVSWGFSYVLNSTNSSVVRQ